MKTSTDRILTTHTGSLPRTPALIEMLLAGEKGEEVDAAAFEAEISSAVAQTVSLQREAGIDIVSDGETSKPSYATYVHHRIDGIELNEEAGKKAREVMLGRDWLAHPDLAARRSGGFTAPFPGCVGPLSYADTAALQRDLDNLAAATAGGDQADVFMTAPSPGILTRFVINQHYPDEETYVGALADVMRTEYKAITDAGFLLQIDCPDLASARNNQYRELSDSEFRKIAERNVEALNAATADIAPEQMRMHMCWGNYEGPHDFDLPLADIIDVVFKARPQAISFEGANPRHEHEWEDLQSVRIPDDKILIPGLIDSTTNFIEHPKLVAQRIGHYTDLVGRERVIAGVDCGFGTMVHAVPMLADSIVWSKLSSLSEGAAIASSKLWN